MAERDNMPDWSILIKFGLPVNSRDSENTVPDYDKVEKNLILASQYLMGKKRDENNGRYYDSFKALLIALKIHFPSEFKRIEKIAGIDFNEAFELYNITGRDIKLRNISLSLISSYYRNQLKVLSAE